MNFITGDMNDISWIKNPEEYPNVCDTVKRIMHEGKWDEFISLHEDENGVVDCDLLYDILYHDSGDALLSVGLHDNEATAYVGDVLRAWEEENKPLKVKRDDKGEPTNLLIYECRGYVLSFETVDSDGEVDSVDLDSEDAFDLLKYRISGANNATEGAWDTDDPDIAMFEMWRGN